MRNPNNDLNDDRMENDMCESQGYLEPFKKTFIPVTSAAQWIAIEEQLKGLFPSLTFSVDGHVISVRKHQKKENSYGLYVYIDGKINPEKCFLSKGKVDFDPIVKLVWRRCEKRLFSKAKVDLEFAQMKGSKKYKEGLRKEIGLDKTMVTYRYDFSTASSLVRQFRKIDGILVEC